MAKKLFINKIRSSNFELQLVDPLTTSSPNLIKKQEEEPKTDPI